MKRRDILINIQSSVIKFELWLTDILVVMTDLSTDWATRRGLSYNKFTKLNLHNGRKVRRLCK